MAARPSRASGSRRACAVRITLTAIENNDEANKIYHPGDVLSGQVQVDYDDGVVVDDIALSLEGVARTWVDHNRVASATQYERRVSVVGQGQRCTLHFKFRIAYRCFPDHGLGNTLSILPPSLLAGKTSLDQHGNRCAQPLIYYGIRATILHRAGAGGAREHTRHFHAINFIPWTEAGPPLSIEDFPGEFAMEVKKSLRKSWSRTSIGQMTMSMKEPSPLPMFSQPPRGRSQGTLFLRYQPAEVGCTNAQLPRLACEVQMQIIRKIYWSTVPLGAVASTRLLEKNRFLRQSRDVVHHTVWAVNPLCWDRESVKLLERNQVCTATIPITIESRKQLLPTFAGPLATLRYSLRLTLTIAQLKHSPLVLEVPLQVYYCRRREDGADELRSSMESTMMRPTPMMIPSGLGGVDEVLEIELPPAYGS